MLSTVLNSERAIQVNIEIMRAFVRLRKMLSSNAALARRVKTLEKKYDHQFKVVFEAIYRLMEAPGRKKGDLGFRYLIFTVLICYKISLFAPAVSGQGPLSVMERTNP